MKKTALVLGIAALSLCASMAYAGSFSNGGFENGTLSGWTQGGGNWSDYGNAGPSVYVPWNGTLPPATAYTGGTPNNTVMSAGVDPYTGQSVVYNGKYSVRVNDQVNNYSVSTISQSVTNYTAKNMYFEWNAVLEGSHGLTDSDYFALTLQDDTTHQNVLTRSFSSASATGLFTDYNGWYGSGWRVEQIDIDALGLSGHDFTLSLVGSDCPYGGHAGYVYLDGFDTVIVNPGPGVPEPSTMLLLGAGLAGLGLFGRKFRKS